MEKKKIILLAVGIFSIAMTIVYFSFSYIVKRYTAELMEEQQEETVEETVSEAKVPEISREELIRDLITKLGNQSPQSAKDNIFASLGEIDPVEESLWREVADFWNSAYKPDFVRRYDPTNGGEPLPADLPQDDSLCIVVLGFQLNSDGSVKNELVDRLMTAMDCAAQYPNAYVLTTGGPTAANNPDATEAEAMADWLIEHGLSPERVIVENASMVTYENAVFSCRILTEKYPSVDSIAIVTSDYHISMGCVLFDAQGLAYTYREYTEGKRNPLRVVANAGCVTDGRYSFSTSSVAYQLQCIDY